jgi:2-desacetyl-2-hydroxyethyl bacteriochlorophyllide A dehydrogenase
MDVDRTDAVVFPEPGHARVEEVPLPEMGPDELSVHIEYSCISNGTERWCLTDRLVVPGMPPLIFPHVPGYQAAGTVAAVGSRVRGIDPGDRVFSRNCREPDSFKGSWWGGHVRIHINNLQDVVKLPRDVSTFEGSVLLLAQVGYNGATKPQVSPGDVAVVIGEGLVGQFAGQVLRSRGAHVIIAGLDPERLDLALQFSADEVFDNSGNTLVEFVKDSYPDGVPIVLETASSNGTVRMATELLGRNGQLILNGFYPPEESMIDWHWLRRKEITLYCPDSRNRVRLEATLSQIQEGVLRVEELVTHRFCARDAADAYALLLQTTAQHSPSGENSYSTHAANLISTGYLGILIDWTG